MKKVRRLFIQYVSQNVLGMLGISCYILADTFFIARAAGANGITALNLVLPIYSLIFAIGSMIGVGSAIRFTIEKNEGKKEADHYFFQAILFATVIGLLFTGIGATIPGRLIALLGGDEEIVATGTAYTRIFLLFC